MSRIAAENNDQEPLEIYKSWGRWRVVKTEHYDEAKGITIQQYTLQRFSDNKKFGRLYHLVAFFWSIEDLDEFIEALQSAANAIEDIDGPKVLRKAVSNDPGTSET